jgi:hypothetical protein
MVTQWLDTRQVVIKLMVQILLLAPGACTIKNTVVFFQYCLQSVIRENVVRINGAA